MSYRFLIDQVLCAKAYILLKNGLRETYGITENPAFEYVKHEKPVLRDYPDIHFNLSHCKHGVLCVIDDKPIGCDIEEIENAAEIITQSAAEDACSSKEEIETGENSNNNTGPESG